MQTIEPRPSEASKKTYERSEFRVAFDLVLPFQKITKTVTKKLPQESSETRFNRV